MKSTSVVTDWFDNTVKRDAENTKRNLEKRLKEEAKLASIELLQRRRARIRVLYEKEANS